MADETTAIIEKLGGLSGKLSVGDDTARSEALQLSRLLTSSLEKPATTAVDLAFAPFLSVAARVAVDLDLFKYIAQNVGPISSKALEAKSGAEELLISTIPAINPSSHKIIADDRLVRILRPLSSIGFVKENGERTWVATPITHAMATDEIASGHRMIGDMILGAAQKAPKYFREYGYHCPTNPRDGFMQYAFQTKLTTFELFTSMPTVFKDFNTFMGNTMGARGYWVDWYPLQDRLLDGADPDSALLVDVGAGKGHDLQAFHEKFPKEGPLFLQDLGSVIHSLTGLSSGIHRMTYDFFEEQPVKGARAYFYHHILHDWSDEYCFKILEQVKKAMKPGYSKLLLHEMIIPEEGAATFFAMLDMTMMAFNSGMERTEKQWEALLDRAGFQVIKFWPPPEQGADGIVEAELKE